jgi:non-ribosomal peptide synthetase component E (peptide arylation enzyme)
MALLIGDIVTQATRMVPDAIAGSLGSQAVRFAQLDEEANRNACALYGLGIRCGPPVWERLLDPPKHRKALP